MNPDTPITELWHLLGLQSDLYNHPEGSFRVFLRSYGGNKIASIKTLREVLGVDLKEAKALAESAPCLLEKEFTFRAAVLLVKRLARAGALAAVEGVRADHDPELCRQLAQHPNASQPLLEYLSLVNDSLVQEHLAKNPNLSLELISVLVPLQPRAFLQNPVFPLLLLEDPLLQRLGPAALLGLITVDECIPLLFSAALGSQAACLFFAREKVHLLSEAQLLALVEHSDSAALEALGFNPTLPVALQERLAKEEDPKRRGAVAMNPRLPLALLRDLLDDPDLEVRATAIKNVQLPLDWLPPYQEGSPSMNEAFAQQLKTPAAILQRLINCGDDYIWSLLADHPNVTPEILEKLAREGDSYTRWAVMFNPKCTKDVLEAGLGDEDNEVRDEAKRALQQRFSESL